MRGRGWGALRMKGLGLRSTEGRIEMREMLRVGKQELNLGKGRRAPRRSRESQN